MRKMQRATREVCEKRNVECFRPERRPSFRQGSTANYDGTFSREQRWVNSRPRACESELPRRELLWGDAFGLDILTGVQVRFDSRAPNSTPTPTQEKDIITESPASHAPSLPDTRVAVSAVLHETGRNLSEGPAVVNPETGVEDLLPPIPTPTKRRRTEPAPQDGGHFFPASPAGSGASGASPWSNAAVSTGRVRLREDEVSIHSPHAVPQSVDHFSPSAGSYHTTNQDHDLVGNISNFQPSEGIQEACLLRYFVEELSQWVTCHTVTRFDLCDEERYFQLVVVRRARSCQPLRDAIFAVAARHLCRHPKFRSESGGGGVIVYQRQLLPDLTPQSAFEYMLRCIPALHEVSSTQDEEYRENLAAAALILRQFEEMDPEESQSAPSSDFGIANGDGNGTSTGHVNNNANFIDITKAILRAAPPSQWSGLLSAVYWVAVRQEIYFALTLERSPQITARPDQGREVSFANRLIWFMSEVAKWKMGDRIEGEWGESFTYASMGDPKTSRTELYSITMTDIAALRLYDSFMIFEDHADKFGLPEDKSPTGEHIEKPNIKSEK
ncbi:hypothetical protein Landi51_13086 [Colletotrichum acutatum]